MDFCARRRPCALVPTQALLSMKFCRLAALLAMLALSTLAAGQTTTSTFVNSAPNPSVFGQSVTFTAFVGGGTNGVTVTFLDGSNPAGTGILNSQQAIFTTSSLSKGLHTITANYPGDANTTASSGSLDQNVTGSTPSTTVISSSQTPANQGQPITITMIVTGNSGTPTGSVNVFDNGSPFIIGFGLSSGQGSFQPSLSPEIHVLRADYQGDATDMGSSGQFMQVITIPSK